MSLPTASSHRFPWEVTLYTLKHWVGFRAPPGGPSNAGSPAIVNFAEILKSIHFKPETYKFSDFIKARGNAF
jgi:hypothetical protein